jgi:hypothetical protein
VFLRFKDLKKQYAQHQQPQQEANDLIEPVFPWLWGLVGV